MLRGVLLLAATLMSGGCKEEASTVATQAAAVVDFRVTFDARFGEHAASCAKSGSVWLNDLRFYVHAVEVSDEAGRREAVSLAASDWQAAGVALLDFEDATGACSNGSSGTNRALVGRVPAGKWTQLHFNVGVPFDLNHGPPARAAGPLTLTSMHWGWLGGYKFVRFEAETADGNDHLVHIGSTGCQGTIGDISSCDRENRARATVPLAGSTGTVVTIQLEALVPAGDGVSCMGNTAAECATSFEAFGLGLESGAPVAAAPIFRAGGRE